MKTTIELPDDLVKQLKLRALHDGRKLKETVAEVLRKGLNAPDEPSIQERESPLTFDPRSGLPLIRCRSSARNGEEMTPEKVADILLQQEVEWQHDAR
jgi:plasmid stability protein